MLGFLKRNERAVEADIFTHLDLLTREYMARGLGERDAALAARRAFGSVQHTMDVYRDQRGLPVLDALRQDGRSASRSLARDLRFTCSAALTLGLGIGLATAVFSAVDAVLVRPLPYDGIDRIVLLGSTMPDANATTGEIFHYVRERLTGFEQTAAYRGGGSGWNLTVGSRAEYVRGLAVSQGYFRVFGTAPLLGRDFRPEEDSPNGHSTVLISEALWERYFDRRPDVLGQFVQLGGRPYEVIGVMPQDFHSIPRADVWTPLQVSPQDGSLNYALVARLDPTVSLVAANAQLDVFKPAIAREVRGMAKNFPDRVARMLWLPFQTAATASNRFVLLLLLGATTAVLLIACANVAALQLVRAIRRGREWATRVALGGGRGRIANQVVVESMLIGIAAAAVGTIVAWLALQAVLPFVSEDVFAGRVIRLDGRVLGASIGVALIASLVSGVWPALAVTRLDYRAALNARQTTASRHQQWCRRAFVLIQVAAATLLLIGAGLFLRTLTTAARVELGFDPDRVVLAQMSLQGMSSSFAALYERTLDRLSQLPDVEGAAVGNNVPVERGLNLPVVPTGRIQEMRTVDWRYVTPDYFRALGIALRTGRMFELSDQMLTARVAIVNEAFASAYFGDPLNALGQTVSLVPALDDLPRQIVGVVADVRTRAGTGWTRGHALAAPAAPTLYVPVAQVPEQLAAMAHGPFPVNWIVKTRSAAAEIAALEEILRSEMPTLPIIRFVPMRRVIDESVQVQQLMWRLFGFFSAVALNLAAFGIYTLLSYSVVQRTREIGIAMALGATAGRVVVTFVREGLLLTISGAIIGLLTAAAGTRFVTALIFGIRPLDPAAFGTAAVLLMLVAAVASLLPARRAARTDPMLALRCE